MPEPRPSLPRAAWGLVRDTVAAASHDDLATRAAALSFFTLLSLSPIFVLLLYATTLVGFDAQAALVDQVRVLLGTTAAAAVREIVEVASVRPALGRTSALLSIAMLLVSGTAVFMQLQSTLNHVWNVTPRPGRGVRGWLRRRALSFGMLAVLAFLLVVSLAATTAVHALVRGDGAWASAGTEATSGVVVAAAFTMLFRLVPDAHVAWRDATVGGVTTAVLFGVGKYVIGVWLGQSSVGSSYGAAGSLVVLLVWTYYSTLIVLFGAELTQTWSDSFGAGIVPKDFARRHGRRGRAEP